MDTSTAVTVIISVPGVLALVNLVKTVVNLGKWAALTSFVIGIGVNVAAFYAGVAYSGDKLFSVVCVGALVGMASSGLYDLRGGDA